MRCKALVLLFLLCGSSLYAQNTYTVSQFGSETWSFVKQPTRWDGSDWLKIGVIGAGTFLIMETADLPIRRLVNHNTKYAKSFPIEFGNMWGEVYFTEILFSGFTLYALYIGDNTAHKVAFEIAQATFYTFYVNGTLKFLIGRARPYLEQGNQKYVPFSRYSNPDHQSLPGGHTGIVMALTTVLSRNAGPEWLKVLAYVPAGLSIIGRVYLDKHWTSDVFLGGAIGYYTATWVVDQHERGEDNDPQESQLGIRGMSLQPYLFGDSYGLGLVFTL